MKFLYQLRNLIFSYFRRITPKRGLVIGLIFLVFIVISFKGLTYIEKRNWDNRFGEINYSLNSITYLPNITNILKPSRYLSSSDLPKYKLKIAKSDIEILEKALPDSFSGSLPAESVWVPAKFYSDGKEYEVEIKNRGRMPRHWLYRKKSWRVKFLNEHFQGQRNLNFILPEEKDFFAEHFGYHLARKLGLVTPNTSFARLKVNNQSYAAYWVVEHFDEDFLERHQLSSDANFYREGHSGILPGIYEDSLNWEKYSSGSRSLDDNYADIDLLINCLNTCDDQEFETLSSRLIDMENFVQWQAHTAIMGDDHQDGFHNIRIYFNSALGKFQFFPWDVNQFKYDGQLDIIYNPLVARLLTIPDVIHERNVLIWDYVSKKDNLKDDLEYYNNLREDVSSAFYRDQEKRYSNWYYNYRLDDRYQIINNQYNYLYNLLDLKTLSKENRQVKVKLHEFDDRVAKLTFFVHMFSDLELKGIKVEGDFDNYSLVYDSNSNGEYDLSDQKLGQFSLNAAGDEWQVDDFKLRLYAKRILPEPIKYEVLLDVAMTEYNFFIVADKDAKLSTTDFKFDLDNAVTGKSVKDRIWYYDPTTFNLLDQKDLTIDEVIAKYPFIQIDGNNQLKLSQGQYLINETLIIPEGTQLNIEAGADLIFSKEASLVSYSPIIAQGTKSKLITFSGQSDQKFWGVVAIVDTDEKSIFSNCKFTNGEDDLINGTYFSGMLSAYYSDLEVDSCYFENAQADDAINVKYGQTEITNSVFINNSSDAVDLDFCTGHITDNGFISNGNDSVDISGSQVKIENNLFYKSGDKGLSVGEESSPIVFNNLFLSNKIGIEVKDLSEAVIINNTITSSKIGINEYQKKEIFGSGQATIVNSIIWANDQSIVTDKPEAISVKGSIIEHGWAGQDVSEKNPEFIDQDNLDFQASQNKSEITISKDVYNEHSLPKQSQVGVTHSYKQYLKYIN